MSVTFVLLAPLGYSTGAKQWISSHPLGTQNMRRISQRVIYASLRTT